MRHGSIALMDRSRISWARAVAQQDPAKIAMIKVVRSMLAGLKRSEEGSLGRCPLQLFAFKLAAPGFAFPAHLRELIGTSPLGSLRHPEIGVEAPRSYRWSASNILMLK